MSERGYIAVSRSIWNHPLFPDEPMSKREAWLWLLNEAAWKPCRVRSSGGPIDLERGQLSHSLRFIATKFGWSVNKVRRFLACLENEHMVVLKTKQPMNTAQIVITICNYNKFQSSDTPADTATDTPTDTAVDTDMDTKKKNITNNHITSSLRSDVYVAFEIFSDAVDGTDIPSPRKLTRDRESKIKARLSEHGLEVWRDACRKLVASDFCLGRSSTGFVANLDFLLQPKSFNKLIEGAYDNRAPKPPPQPPPKPKSWISEPDFADRALKEFEERNERRDAEIGGGSDAVGARTLSQAYP